ncbi:hypothetical protein G6F60_015454 [Rhizopus arrhizus]|uniref:Uncharacterized protein n=1 Tax=Rhizopus delemar TaxID=936053 RepID=A0A9P7C3J7_9FUNG|nr:hypothetical protein G6F40_015902 [Rhizopus arrhizus]KAG1375284.1 hypothetical protein G6F60_015454 [Rhizopus arrhizus]KAG1533547.1 hypothetical protein G6F50_015842 [Rhizopus delemar]
MGAGAGRPPGLGGHRPEELRQRRHDASSRQRHDRPRGPGVPGRQRPGALPQRQPVVCADHRRGSRGQRVQTDQRHAVRTGPALRAVGRQHAVQRGGL